MNHDVINGSYRLRRHDHEKRDAMTVQLGFSRFLALVVGVLIGLEMGAVGMAHAQPDDAAPSDAPTAAPLDCAGHRVPGPAGEPSTRDIRKAKKLAKKAERACRGGKSDSCVELLGQAYAKAGTSAWLRSIGDAHRAAGQVERAMCVYGQYLEAAPDAEDRAEVAGHVSALASERVAEEQKRARIAGALVEVEAKVDCSAEVWTAPENELSRKERRALRKKSAAAQRQCAGRDHVECARLQKELFALDNDTQRVRAAAQAYRELGAHEAAICAYRFVLRSERVPPDADQLAAEIVSLFGKREEAREREASMQAAAAEARRTVVCDGRYLTAPAPDAVNQRKARSRSSSADRACAKAQDAKCTSALVTAFEHDGDPAHLRDLGGAYMNLADYHGAVCALRQYEDLAQGAASGVDVSAQLGQAQEKLIAEREEKERVAREIETAIADIGCATRRIEKPDGEIRSSDRKRAHSLMQQASEQCRAGELAGCLETLKAAYKYDGEPGHLRSIALQYAKLEDKESEICAYHQFLEVNTNTRLVESNYNILAAKSQAYNQRKQTREELAVTKETLQETTGELEKTSENLELEAQGKQKAEERAREEEAKNQKLEQELTKTTTWIRGRARSTAGTTPRYVGTGLLGVGALSLGMGVLYALDARNTQSTIEGTTTWGPEFDELVARGESYRTRSLALSATGGVLVLAGAALYYWGEVRSRNVEVEVEIPKDAKGTAAIRLGGRF